MAQEVHNVPFFPLQYTFSSRGLSKHSGCTTNSEAGQHVKRESRSRSYCKGSEPPFSLFLCTTSTVVGGGRKLKFGAKTTTLIYLTDDIVKALPPFPLYVEHSGCKGNANWKIGATKTTLIHLLWMMDKYWVLTLRHWKMMQYCQQPYPLLFTQTLKV